MASNSERWLSKATGALFAQLPEEPPTPLATSSPKKLRIREKWLRFTPAMVKTIDDREELKTLLSWYFPAEQGRTVEEQAYIEEMYDCIYERLLLIDSVDSTIVISDDSIIDVSSDSVECLD